MEFHSRLRGLQLDLRERIRLLTVRVRHEAYRIRLQDGSIELLEERSERHRRNPSGEQFATRRLPDLL